jgi:LysR family glycine cleavage system transcriptional activator
MPISRANLSLIALGSSVGSGRIRSASRFQMPTAVAIDLLNIFRSFGQVSVNAEPLFTLKWLVPRLGDFYDRFPEIELRLEANQELADIARYEADLAIRFINAGPKNQSAVLLSDAPLYPYAAPELVPEPIPAQALLALPLLRDRREDTWRHWVQLAGCIMPESNGSDWRMRGRLTYEAALAGHGVLLTSREIAERDVALGRLVQCSDIGFRTGSYHLVVAEGVVRRSAVRLFCDWLLDQSTELRSS